MNDARLGIARLTLPDERTIALQLTYERLDRKGHGWVMERLETLQRAKAGSSQALADLLDILSAGEVTRDAVMAAPAASYPLGLCTPAIWRAWELAYHGPAGRPGTESREDPPSARRTLWKRLFGRRSERE